MPFERRYLLWRHGVLIVDTCSREAFDAACRLLEVQPRRGFKIQRMRWVAEK